GMKAYALYNGISAPLITNIPYFYIAITCMIIGTQLFLAGFLGELITRNSSERNQYTVVEELK
ncbi:MAG: glycosyltransferase, partial [Bacteroidales bacterium]|nr:glycosyltransferase [Bacteroidales bacterium]